MMPRHLQRPAYERPFVPIPIGYPADDCVVPYIQRKTLDQIMVVDRGSVADHCS